uniref:Uncharacterized protein n=1 Tax=Salix viminalis TaxID=40686 RepID=A0A6N2M7Q1_SALVM
MVRGSYRHEKRRSLIVAGGLGVAGGVGWVGRRRERCVAMERFRQLERAKEMRQQRELLKLFSEADHVHVQSQTMACESSKLLHSELTLSPRQPMQASLSFQPTLQTEHNDVQAPIVANLCSTDSVRNLRYNFDESDVDTSLHL